MSPKGPNENSSFSSLSNPLTDFVYPFFISKFVSSFWGERISILFSLLNLIVTLVFADDSFLRQKNTLLPTLDVQ